MSRKGDSTESYGFPILTIGFFLSFVLRSCSASRGREPSVDDSAVETAETRANGRFRPGTSGKPAGGPKGAKKKTTLLAEEAMEEKVGAVAAYASMSWPQLIDAMWDAEEAERKGPSVPAETPPAEAQATDTGDRALDGALRPVEAEPIVTPSADANHEINREIQAGAWSHPAVPFDETVLEGPHQRPRRWLRLRWSRVGSDRAIAPPPPAAARRVRLPEGERRQLAAHRL